MTVLAMLVLLLFVVVAVGLARDVLQRASKEHATDTMPRVSESEDSRLPRYRWRKKSAIWFLLFGLWCVGCVWLFTHSTGVRLVSILGYIIALWVVAAILFGMVRALFAHRFPVWKVLDRCSDSERDNLRMHVAAFETGQGHESPRLVSNRVALRLIAFRKIRFGVDPKQLDARLTAAVKTLVELRAYEAALASGEGLWIRYLYTRLARAGLSDLSGGRKLLLGAVAVWLLIAFLHAVDISRTRSDPALGTWRVQMYRWHPGSLQILLWRSLPALVAAVPLWLLLGKKTTE